MSSKAEEQIQLAIVNYIRYQYPDVLFRSDAAGFKLSVGQAKKMKALNGGIRAWPDLFIAEPKGKYSGLFLEIKKDGVRIFKQDGTLVSDEHIREQFDMLADLRQRGYAAEFAIGFEGAKKLIDDYLKGELCED